MRQYLLVFVVSLCLVACKPASHSRQGEVDTPHASMPSTAFVEVRGRVVKGVLAGALVEYYSVNSAGDRAARVAQTTTDDDGYFSTSIDSSYFSQPLRIAVRSLTGETQMRCDLLAGCDSQNYGDLYVLNSDSVLLEALVPSLKQNAVHNISLLTQLAVGLKTRRAAGASDFSSLNATVSSRFGFTGSLLSLPLLDITSIPELSNRSAADLSASFLTAALADLAVENFGEDLFAAIAQFGNFYSAAGIANIDDATQPIDYRAIIHRQIAMIANVPGTNEALQALRGQLRAQVELMALVGDATRTAGFGSASSHWSPLAQVKSLVNEIRQIYLTFGFSKLLAISDISKILNGEVLNALEAFGLNWGDLSLTDTPGVGAVQSAVLDSATAFLLAITNYYAGVENPADINGVSINLVRNGSDFEMLVRQSLNVCEPAAEAEGPCNVEADVILRASIGDFSGNARSNSASFRNSVLSFSGTYAAADALVRFDPAPEGIMFDNLGLVLATNSIAIDGRTENIVDIGNLEVNVPLTIELDDGNAYMKVPARVLASAASLSILNENTRVITPLDERYFVRDESVYSLVSAEQVSLSLAMKVEQSGQDDFFTAIDVAQTTVLPNTEGFLGFVSASEAVCETSLAQGCVTQLEDSVIFGETADAFLGIAVSIATSSVVDGYNEPVNMLVTGERVSPTINDISTIKASVPGYAVALKGAFNSIGGIVSLSGNNLDGSTVDIYSVAGEREGAVYDSAGLPWGICKDMGEWIKLTYTDNTFESI